MAGSQTDGWSNCFDAKVDSWKFEKIRFEVELGPHLKTAGI